MKNILSKILVCSLAMFVLAFVANAQVTPVNNAAPSETPTPVADGPNDGRQGLLQQIGLTREQVRQLRMLNQRHRPIMMAAQKRLREATVALDQAIYADVLAEGEFETKLKEQQLAQAEVIRVRSLGELAIRKILTSEQLVKFRELRQQFEIMRRENVQRKQNNLEPNSDRPVVNRFKTLRNSRSTDL